MQNRAIMFHDIEVAGIVQVGSQMTLCIKGYMYASDGRPGRDSGSEWLQAGALILNMPAVEERVWRVAAYQWDLPAYVYDGEMKVGDVVLDMLPVPFHVNEQTDLAFKMSDGQVMQLRAVGAELVLLGESEYMEEWPRPETILRPAKEG